MKKGNFIAIPRKGFFGCYGNRPLAELLAGLIAEGNTTRNEVGFTNQNKDIIKQFREAVEFFGAHLIQRKSVKTNFEWHVIGNRVGSHNVNPVLNLGKQHGLYGKRAEEKSLPYIVYKFDYESTVHFLRMLFSCDGGPHSRGIEYCSASEDLARGVQELLMKFGLNSRLRFKANSCKGAWVISLQGKEARAFSEKIGFIGEKQKRVFSWVNPRKGNPNKDNIPHSTMWLYLYDSLSKKERRQVSDILGWKDLICAQRVTRGKMASRRVVQAMVDVKGKQKMKPLYKVALSGSLFWDEIVGIDYVGKKQVYDLEMVGENTHNFLANGIIVHNTWAEVILSYFAHLQGFSPLLVSKEMSAWQIMQRLDARHSRLDYQRLRAGALSTEEEIRWQKDLQKLKNLHPFVVSDDDIGAMTVSSIKAKAQNSKVDSVWIDGMYLIDDERKGGSVWERFTNICRDSKRAARDTNMPWVVTVQFSKEGLKRGMPENIAQGDVAKELDVILGLYQTDDQRLSNPPVMEWEILKQREGRKGLIREIVWDLQNMDFYEVASQGEEGYTPAVSMSTDSEGDNVIPF